MKIRTINFIFLMLLLNSCSALTSALNQGNNLISEDEPGLTIEDSTYIPDTSLPATDTNLDSDGIFSLPVTPAKLDLDPMGISVEAGLAVSQRLPLLESAYATDSVATCQIIGKEGTVAANQTVRTELKDETGFTSEVISNADGTFSVALPLEYLGNAFRVSLADSVLTSVDVYVDNSCTDYLVGIGLPTTYSTDELALYGDFALLNLENINGGYDLVMQSLHGGEAEVFATIDANLENMTFIPAQDYFNSTENILESFSDRIIGIDSNKNLLMVTSETTNILNDNSGENLLATGEIENQASHTVMSNQMFSTYFKLTETNDILTMQHIPLSGTGIDYRLFKNISSTTSLKNVTMRWTANEQELLLLSGYKASHGGEDQLEIELYDFSDYAILSQYITAVGEIQNIDLNRVPHKSIYTGTLEARHLAVSGVNALTLPYFVFEFTDGNGISQIAISDYKVVRQLTTESANATHPQISKLGDFVSYQVSDGENSGIKVIHLATLLTQIVMMPEDLELTTATSVGQPHFMESENYGLSYLIRMEDGTVQPGVLNLATYEKFSTYVNLGTTAGLNISSIFADGVLLDATNTIPTAITEPSANLPTSVAPSDVPQEPEQSAPEEFDKKHRQRRHR